jgi:peptidoglycan/LPS O-acetylase OafA/YrhL
MSREQDRFYSSLEAGRGIAALMVALFHIGLSSYLDPSGVPHRLVAGRGSPESSWVDPVFRIFGNGPGAVVFFFVLSGFVLTKVLCSAPKGDHHRYAFLIGRVFRIYPAVILTIGLFCVVFFLFDFLFDLHIASPEEYRPSNIALNASLFRVGINGVTWSLQVEMIAAPLLLALLAAWQRHGPLALSIPFVLLVGLSFIGSWNKLLVGAGGFGEIYAFIPGMAAFLYGEPIVRRLRFPTQAVVAAIVIFAISRAVIGWSSGWTPLAETLSCTAIVAILAFGPYQLGNSIAFRTARFFGRISFSFYLLHPLFLLLPINMTEQITVMVRHANPLLIDAVLFMCSVALITPIAWLQYHFVERGGISAGAHLQRLLFSSRNANAASARAQLISVELAGKAERI